MLEVGFLAGDAVLGEDAILGGLIKKGDGLVESGGGFGFFAFGDQSLDFLYGGADFALAGSGPGVVPFTDLDAFFL